MTDFSRYSLNRITRAFDPASGAAAEESVSFWLRVKIDSAPST
ncbi:hypothetical protein OAF62_04245 [Akkermansiaceae bacterium]|nr:hypothetical protein [Akkermansiaceae bacterium]